MPSTHRTLANAVCTESPQIRGTSRHGLRSLHDVDAGAAKRIVVVEDDPTIAMAVADRLRTEGFVVEVASDGSTGVAVCERERPDLVVLDLMLPGLDGLEVCRRIQRDGHVPVVMLTARDDETDLVVGLAVGADDYLTKPFSPARAGGPHSGRAAARRGRATAPRPAAPGDHRRRRDRRRPAAGLVSAAATSPSPPPSSTCWSPSPRRPARSRPANGSWPTSGATGTVRGARTVDSHIRSLRRKLGDGVIRTVFGVGYALHDEG